MTDRYNSLTVILKKDIRDDDAEPLINAIKMFKGVLNVKGNVSGITSIVAETRVKEEFNEKLLAIVFPKNKES